MVRASAVGTYSKDGAAELLAVSEVPLYPGRPAGLSVLVVEGDPDRQWRLVRHLTVQGHRVVGTSSGSGALALLAEWPVDVVLVGAALGRSSTSEIVRRVRRRTHVPVVEVGDRCSASSASAHPRMTVPPRVDALLASLPAV